MHLEDDLMPDELENDTVMSYMMDDHQRLDAVMQKCQALAESGRMADAAAVFAEFRQGLTRHIKIEEGLLFPEFERASGLAKQGGPTGVMRSEHEEILRLLGLLGELFEGEEPSAAEFESLRSALVALLREHNLKEERIIYPMTDQMVEASRRHELVGKMKRF